MTHGRPKVVVTRTQPGADVLGDVLASAGYTAVVAPVLTIVGVPTETSAVELAAQAEGWVWLSTHAVKFGARRILERIQADVDLRPCWAIGTATSAALANAGWPGVIGVPQVATSEGLLAEPGFSEDVIRGTRWAVVSGRGGRELIVEQLQRRGAAVVTMSVYERVPTQLPTSLSLAAGDVIVVGSGAGLAQLLREIGLDTARQMRWLVPSQRVVDAAKAAGLLTAHRSAGAAPDAIIAALRSMDV